MFAKIYPIQKLPRRFKTFDYELPKGRNFVVGDVIVIPFRNRTLFGIIQTICKTTQETRTLPVEDAEALFHIHPDHLTYLETIASQLGQSVSSILAVAYEGISLSQEQCPYKDALLAPSYSIPRTIVATVKDILTSLSSSQKLALAIDDETTAVLAHLLSKTRKGQTIVLVPRERDARFFAELLAPFSPQILTGRTKSYQRNAILRSWKSGSIKILIGTRQTILIEPKNLENILAIQASCEDHISAFRNPHISAVDSAILFAKQHHANILLTDPLPIFLNTPPTLIHNDPQNIRVVDATNRGENSPYPLLTQTLLEEIKLALHSQKKVLLSFNRKGVAKRLECKACGHVPFCGTCGNLPIVRQDDLLCGACATEMWKPTVCPACQSPKIGPRLIGGARIIADLQKEFPGITVGQIQKGHVDLNADIVVATEYFWSSVITPFSVYRFGLVAELLADVGFIPGDFRGAEKTGRKVQRLYNLAQSEHATCIIQTIARDRLLALLGPEHVFSQEMLVRKKYHLPPYGVIVQFEHANMDELPKEIQEKTLNRHGTLTAKIDHMTYDLWKNLFPLIPDHVNIRIQK